ncbi:MAG: DUF494 domain-containing protein [Burkholderiaceae bacterium]|nr:DUF494 domain-containing protein [Burkholderiaceae bacterium]
MFDILVYLYETYYRPDVCPKPEALAKTLSEIGFKESEIKDALAWLDDLATATHDLTVSRPLSGAFSASQHRVYAEQEYAALGTEAIGFIQSLETVGMLDPVQREIVIERALAVNDSPLPLDKMRVIVLMILWSQGDEPDALTLDALFPDDDGEVPLFH